MEKFQQLYRCLNQGKQEILGGLMLNPPSTGLNSKLVELYIEEKTEFFSGLFKVLEGATQNTLEKLKQSCYLIFEKYEEISHLVKERKSQIILVRRVKMNRELKQTMKNRLVTINEKLISALRNDDNFSLNTLQNAKRKFVTLSLSNNDFNSMLNNSKEGVLLPNTCPQKPVNSSVKLMRKHVNPFSLINGRETEDGAEDESTENMEGLGFTTFQRMKEEEEETKRMVKKLSREDTLKNLVYSVFKIEDVIKDVSYRFKKNSFKAMFKNSDFLLKQLRKERIKRESLENALAKFTKSSNFMDKKIQCSARKSPGSNKSSRLSSNKKRRKKSIVFSNRSPLVNRRKVKRKIFFELENQKNLENKRYFVRNYTVDAIKKYRILANTLKGSMDSNMNFSPNRISNNYKTFEPKYIQTDFTNYESNQEMSQYLQSRSKFLSFHNKNIDRKPDYLRQSRALRTSSSKSKSSRIKTIKLNDYLSKRKEKKKVCNFGDNHIFSKSRARRKKKKLAQVLNSIKII